MEYKDAIEILGQMHVQYNIFSKDSYDVVLDRDIGKCSVWKNGTHVGIHDTKTAAKMVRSPGCDLHDICSFKVNVPEGMLEAPKGIHLGKYLMRRIDSGQFHVSDGTKNIFVITTSVFRRSNCNETDEPIMIKVDDAHVRIADTDEIESMIDAMNMTTIKWQYDDCDQWTKIDGVEAYRLSRR